MPSLRGCRPYDGRPPRSHELAGPLRGHSSGPDPPVGSAVTAPEPPGSQPVAGWRTGASATARPQSSRRTHRPQPAPGDARRGTSLPGQPDRAVHQMAVSAERTAFRAAWLPDGVQPLRIAGTSGIPPVRACRCSGPVADQWPGPGPRDWPRTGGLAQRRTSPEAGLRHRCQVHPSGEQPGQVGRWAPGSSEADPLAWPD